MINSVRVGTVLALTVAIAYTACALVFWMWPAASTHFMTALFHGLDVRKLQTSAGEFGFESFGYALAGITVWTFLVGYLFGWLANRFMPARGFPYHYESRKVLRAPVEMVFAYLDDLKKLSAHMEQRSGMMLGARMEIKADGDQGRKIGSRIRMDGKLWGISIGLEEVVTERKPPLRKWWETTECKLLVIGNYRLGFVLEPDGSSCAMRVFIDYYLPAKPVAHWLGVLFGKLYARWCTERIAAGAVEHFSPHPASLDGQTSRRF